MTFSDVMTLISNWAIPLVVAIVCFWAILKKVPVYSVFTEGAKEDFSTAVMIIPYQTRLPALSAVRPRSCRRPS